MSEDLLTDDTLDDIAVVLRIPRPAEHAEPVREQLPVIIPFQEAYVEPPRNRRPSFAVRAWRAIASCFGLRK